MINCATVSHKKGNTIADSCPKLYQILSKFPNTFICADSVVNLQ